MSNGLIVYVGGLNEGLTRIQPLLAEIDKLPELHGYDSYVYPEPIRRFSRGSLTIRCEELATAISNYWQTQGKPTDIVLMGHSVGGLMVRYAYLVAAGKTDDPRQNWTPHVSRVVLFAAPNRGISPQRLGFPRNALIRLVLSLSHGWTAAEILRGAPFLTDLRIRWMRLFRRMENPPLVVQIRGTRDTAVLADDSIDLEALPNSVTIEIFRATHRSLIEPVSKSEDRPGEQLELLTHAIVGDLRNEPGLAASPSRGNPAAAAFLLHGIRAGIFDWIAQLREQLRTTGSVSDTEIVVEAGSYGYLSAYKFMLPWGHDRQLRLFADWYTQMVSAYGDVPFHFVGHSNGTYIFGRSLQRVPSMTFDNVYLAGSVLPRGFQWVHHRNQVTRLVNVCASRDVPVGILCNALRGLGRRGLGVGGFDGFDDAPQALDQVIWVDGGHGAGLATDRLPRVATYVRTGAWPVLGEADTSWPVTEARLRFRRLSRMAPVLAIGVAGVIVTGVIASALWVPWAAALELLAIGLVLLALSVL